MKKIFNIQYTIFYVLLVEVLLSYLLLRTPVTAFSQNILKTSIFLFMTISPVYLYIIVFRLMKRVNRRLTIKQIYWFISYLLGLFVFALAADSFLSKIGYDVHKIAANVLALVLLIAYLIIQHVFLARRNSRDLVNQN